MTGRDKIGIFVLVALFVVLCWALVMVFRNPFGQSSSPSESIFVKQRIVNLNKSR